MAYSGLLDGAIEEIDKLRRHLKKENTRQVQSVAERELIRAYASAWTTKHRPNVVSVLPSDLLSKADSLYEKVATATYRAIGRAVYLSDLKQLREELVAVQSKTFVKSVSDATPTIPNFSSLVQNSEMGGLLVRRTQEIIYAIEKSPLSATVMMGALLEALFLARINLLKDRKTLFKLKSTPKDKAGKALELKEWGLNDFIEVSHEIGWIRKPLKDVSTVMRDYRNIIHPVKELSLMKELGVDVLITVADAKMFWRVFVELCEQISESAIA
jgi:hypothetical protein